MEEGVVSNVSEALNASAECEDAFSAADLEWHANFTWWTDGVAQISIGTEQNFLLSVLLS